MRETCGKTIRVERSNFRTDFTNTYHQLQSGIIFERTTFPKNLREVLGGVASVSRTAVKWTSQHKSNIELAPVDFCQVRPLQLTLYKEHSLTSGACVRLADLIITKFSIHSLFLTRRPTYISDYHQLLDIHIDRVQ